MTKKQLFIPYMDKSDFYNNDISQTAIRFGGLED